MSTPQKELKKEAQKFLHIKSVFPNKPPDFRKKLSKYQVGKIKKAIAEVKKIGGDQSHLMVPMGIGRARYMKENDFPSYMRGIFISGGDKVTKNLKYTRGEIYYERNGSPRSRTELDTSGDENTLLASADKILKKRNSRKATVTANGFAIGSAQNMRSNDLIKKEAARIFNKYVEAFDRGEMRERLKGGKLIIQKAAHPSEWGMGILFESSERVKNGAKKKGGKFVKKHK